MSETDDADIVWLRGTAEVPGADVTVIYQAWRRAEWEGLTDAARERATEDVGAWALEVAHVEYGAGVMNADEIAEIPDDERADALAELSKSGDEDTGT